MERVAVNQKYQAKQQTESNPFRVECIMLSAHIKLELTHPGQIISQIYDLIINCRTDQFSRSGSQTNIIKAVLLFKI